MSASTDFLAQIHAEMEGKDRLIAELEQLNRLNNELVETLRAADRSYRAALDAERGALNDAERTIKAQTGTIEAQKTQIDMLRKQVEMFDTLAAQVRACAAPRSAA